MFIYLNKFFLIDHFVVVGVVVICCLCVCILAFNVFFSMFILSCLVQYFCIHRTTSRQRASKIIVNYYLYRKKNKIIIRKQNACASSLSTVCFMRESLFQICEHQSSMDFVFVYKHLSCNASISTEWSCDFFSNEILNLTFIDTIINGQCGHYVEKEEKKSYNRFDSWKTDFLMDTKYQFQHIWVKSNV